jgi:phenylacetic acid degradation operon negative regulatory protein
MSIVKVVGVKPRSLLLDLFGDYLRFAGSEVRAGDLVALLAVLGVEPATTRVTLSRLKNEGWFTTERVGRETLYRLSDELLRILDDGRERIFADYADVWDGWWTQVVFQLPESDRAVRDQLKRKLSWLGFGPLTPSTWLSPRSQVDHARALRQEFPSAHISVVSARTDDFTEDRALVEQCWDLDALNADYAEFIRDHRELADMATEISGEAALIARVEVVSTFRHFPFRDPSLPEALRPSGWCGEEAHALFLALHDALAPAAVDYVSEVVGVDLVSASRLAKNI